MGKKSKIVSAPPPREFDTLGSGDAATPPQRTIKSSHKTGAISRKVMRKAVHKVMSEGR